MTQILKRALPFVLAFVFGITCTAIFRSVVPSRRMTRFYEGRWSHCPKQRRGVAIGRFIPFEEGTPSILVTHLQYLGGVGHSAVRLNNDGEFMRGLTAKESALVVSGSGTNAVVSYVSPEAIDGLPVTLDARLLDVPQPSFWLGRQNDRVPGCNTLVRVELDQSGTVSDVNSVTGYGDRCTYLDDILGAARRIRFRPALRDGVPVSQRISILYNLD